jgi:hypothetical protein
MTLYVLIAAAADPSLKSFDMMAIESAYFPWIGALHSLLDSLVDHEEDIATGERGLIDCYPSPLDAATRMRAIAREALDRAAALPQGRRHKLIVAAMTSFYLCELSDSASPHARLVAPSVLSAVGGLAAPTMAILSARRSLRGVPVGVGIGAGRSAGVGAGSGADRSAGTDTRGSAGSGADGGAGMHGSAGSVVCGRAGGSAGMPRRVAGPASAPVPPRAAATSRVGTS